MLSHEISPEEVGFTKDQSAHRQHIARWLSNLAFSDVLKLDEHGRKFPGTVAVSLSRAQLNQH
jgi:hypothetical protein